ncbi:hypothetical protein [Aromatoleum evansii]|uniref:hypothetical protein n=1 Tax=Aromatoleum evansii TaxID=59406 RepID=UPI00145C4454|nr:hypothetical protein [Aromatoleum evansii]NMG30066.1 hypothetical protein [Aromatoleum evansii]
MVPDDFRFVAHIDILGMSSIVERDADAAWGMLSELAAVRDHAQDFELEFLDTKERLHIREAVYAVTFSDTIVLFTKVGSDTELRCMIVLVAEILHKAMCRCVPVRAGLAFGKFYFNLDRSMYAGPALIEAYRVGESAQWIGITLADSVREKAANLQMTSGSRDVIVDWDVPIKCGIIRRSVVNWPAVFAHDLAVAPPICIQQFYQGFENTFGAYSKLPPEAQEKYVNTVEFINAQRIRHHQA